MKPGACIRGVSRAVALLVALEAGGCCGDGTETGTVYVTNETPYFLHVLHPDETMLYLPPGESTHFESQGTATLTVVIAPGQGVEARVDETLSCCTNDDDGSRECGSARATWEDGLVVAASFPTCDNSDGSCPFVYSHDGQAFALEGEALVGALNLGAAREDAVVLGQARPTDGVYRVRLATERAELDHLDAVALEVVDHPLGSQVLRLEGTDLVGVRGLTAPRRAVDATGRDLRPVLSSADGRSWEAAAASVRDWVELEFPRPPGAKHAVLALRGRNTQRVQDAFHAYMRQFGPGLPKLMRLTSEWRWYRPTLARLLHQAGFTVRVQVWSQAGWREAGEFAPVGPAAMQTVGLRLALPEEESPSLRLRLEVLPGAWEVDALSASLAPEAPLQRTQVLARQVGHLGGQAAAPIEPEALLAADGRREVLSQGEALELEFLAPPELPGMQRTAALRVTGFYEEAAWSRRPCMQFRLLAANLTADDAFARFMLRELAWERVVDGFGERAGVPRSGSAP
jgi:hypothetical protein